MIINRLRHLKTIAVVGLVAAAALALVQSTAVSANDTASYQRQQADFDDVKAELEDAIIKEGLKIDYTGNIGQMLERTGADVGSTKPVYTRAEFITFCSAKLSRAMMEADPANLSQCPYVMHIYATAAAPKTVVVGYRKVNVGGAGAAALTEINTLLDRVAKAATR